MKALLIANPHSGGWRGSSPEEVQERLRAEGLRVRSLPVRCGEEIAETLSRALRDESPEHTRVVIAGGDGTLHAALPALVDTDFPLAMLPVGTCNVLARDVGVPLDLSGAIAVAAAGRPCRVDLGLANGRPFCAMAGMGYDGALLRTVIPTTRKRLWAYASYAARALHLLLRYRPSRFRILADGRELIAPAWMAVIANARHYLFHWQVARYAHVDDGLLDLCLFRRDSTARTLGQVTSVLRGRHGGYPGVVHLRARRFRIECDPPVDLQMDGDPMAVTPLEAEVKRGALLVVSPQ